MSAAYVYPSTLAHLDALTATDYAPVQGFVLAMGLLFVLINLLVDLLYTLIDPRISLGAA